MLSPPPAPNSTTIGVTSHQSSAAPIRIDIYHFWLSRARGRSVSRWIARKSAHPSPGSESAHPRRHEDAHPQNQTLELGRTEPVTFKSCRPCHLQARLQGLRFSCDSRLGAVPDLWSSASRPDCNQTLPNEWFEMLRTPVFRYAFPLLYDGDQGTRTSAELTSLPYIFPGSLVPARSSAQSLRATLV
jgi:hypothetical protein